MLARGWLAYPVTSIHSHLPPKSGCRNHIHRFALSRRRATSLFRNPVRKAQRSVPGFSSTPTSACRRYATSPPSSDCASPSSAIIIGLRQRRDAETAEERFNMLARGWLAYPVTSMHTQLPPKSGCINVIPAKLPRDPYFLSIARKAEPEAVDAVAQSAVATVRHTTVPRIVIATATTEHTAGTR